MTNKLPQGWVECKLGDIVEYKKGKKPKVLQAEYSEGLLPYVDIKCFEKNIIENYTNSNDGVLIDNKNILVVWDGARAGFCGSYNNRGILGSTIMALSPLLVNKKLIEYFIQSKFQILNKQTKGTGIPHVKPDLFWNFLFKLPPLNEQKRIVEKIEEEFGKIDEGVEKLKLAQEQIKQYRQSVLKSAFEGKLYKTTEWEEKTLEEITSYIQRGKSPKYSEEENNYFIINQKCIRWNNLQCEFKKFVTPVFWDSLSQERFLQAGDILWNSTGTGTIGRAYLFKGDELNSAIVDSHVTIVRVKKDDILSEFLFYFIMSPFVQYKIETMQNGSTNQVELGRTEIKNTRINLPTIDEQKQIVKEIEKRFEAADEAERVIAENLEKAEQLKQSILKKAFEGRLVPQDPTDQPASELLAQIQAERNK